MRTYTYIHEAAYSSYRSFAGGLSMAPILEGMIIMLYESSYAGIPHGELSNVSDNLVFTGQGSSTFNWPSLAADHQSD